MPNSPEDCNDGGLGQGTPGTSTKCVRIRGVQHYLWRAVDQHGVVLDILVQERRNGTAAKRFFKHLLGGLGYKPRRLVTDGLPATALLSERSCRRYDTGPAGI